MGEALVWGLRPQDMDGWMTVRYRFFWGVFWVGSSFVYAQLSALSAIMHH